MLRIDSPVSGDQSRVFPTLPQGLGAQGGDKERFIEGIRGRIWEALAVEGLSDADQGWWKNR